MAWVSSETGVGLFPVNPDEVIRAAHGQDRHDIVPEVVEDQGGDGAERDKTDQGQENRAIQIGYLTGITCQY